ncbi:hypothetical protein F4819DRAFT_448637 [Hypoxylon fuscum]|nr:hypothetical protein F4819DRAFT_448637 [Hypoxylon fuscum]
MAEQKELVPAYQSFPTAQPALRLKTGFNQKFICGDIHSGSTLVAVPLIGGTLESVGDFEPKVKFTISNGTDWFRIDADKTYGRVSVRALATDEKGLSVCIIVDGVVTLNETTMPLVFGAPNATTAPFGFGIENFKIETGHEEYKPLESMVFVGSQRFVKEEGDIVGVEARISRIISGSGME